MIISDNGKEWIRKYLRYNETTGSLTDDTSWDNAVARRIDPATGELMLVVVMPNDFEEIPATSVAWFLKTGEWPEHGVKLKDKTGNYRALLRWSNLKKVGKREHQASTNKVVSADLLRRVLVVLGERWEIDLMKEIEEVLRS